MPLDYTILNKGKSVLDQTQLQKDFELKKQMALATIAKAKQSLAFPDVDKLGEQALYKAAQGLELNPQETAAAKFVNAKSGGIQFDPVTGNMMQKPNIAANLGLDFGNASPQGFSAPQGYAPANNQQDSIDMGSVNLPEIPASYDNPWDAEYAKQMQAASGNPKQQQLIKDTYAKSKLTMTESEAKNAGYADRLNLAEPILTDPNKIAAYSSFWQKAGDAINPFGAQLQSEDYRQYKQAKLNAASARLRQESGASISPTEYATDAEQLYPQVNDTPAILEQKRQNREALKLSMQRAAGPAYKPLVIKAIDVNADTKPIPDPYGNVKAPAQPTIAEGTTALNPQTGHKIIFKGGQWQDR